MDSYQNFPLPFLICEKLVNDTLPETFFVFFAHPNLMLSLFKFFKFKVKTAQEYYGS